MVIRDSLRISDPTTWPEYLDLCLQLESKFRADKAGVMKHSLLERSEPRDPNAMVVDRVSTLTKEQEGWLERKLCVRCEKHSFVFKQHCSDPKYKDKFEMPKRGQVTRVISTPAALSSSNDDKVREEAVCAFIASYDAKGKEKEVKLEPAVKAARITEVEDDEDFL
ncbi:uncharacterized protein LAESUDRAFT_665896 [Laetiporus sulphureus 93-53]|uniref:Uncharacterized protein n=1 Tax=Laetiporus sulphureus 93-53 TaxID=1314785 RepID=A0A165B996_9APHY|nr:uncharacterized protein LAESUDRAFT_665896 [Laetiporus sulphureus 93-53]KZT00540.1 hypothetical protein LAESUDRAFT_665896 [Laetiporus sulphureus 93-53]